ncbi:MULTISPECIES: hypothetical protein [unclassified Streptomyces]|nr:MULTISPECIES: hypothetical protein [unclassified Streptomyces]
MGSKYTKRYTEEFKRDAIAAKLNNRPRKCLGFRTPAESVALTG